VVAVVRRPHTAACRHQLQADAYRYLMDRLNIDAVVLADGGTDILLRGDESTSARRWRTSPAWPP
jgi:hypothetical protein